MFRCFRREPERPNYAQIFAITATIVAAAGITAMVVYKLFNKYFKICDCECEDFLEEGCADCDVCFEDEADCATEVVVEE